MTENATETSEAPVVNPMQQKFIKQGVELLNDQIAQANELAEAGQRAEQTGKLVFEIRDAEDTDDDKIKKFQRDYAKGVAQLEKWQTDIENYIRQNYPQFNGTDGTTYDPERTAIEYKALVDTIKGTQKALETLNKRPLEGITELKNLPGTRKSSTGHGGTGIKRPRFESVQWRIAGSDKWIPAEMDKRDPKTNTIIGKSSNLSAAAIAISKDSSTKVNAGDLGTACFAQADKDYGTQDLSTLTGKEIVFVVSAADKNYEIQAIPQAQ